MKRLALMALSSAVMLGMLAVPGAAHPRTVLDPPDTEGPLDIAGARLAHRSGETRTRIFLKLVTFEEWSDETLGGAHQFISFEINLDSDAVIERCLVVTRELEPGSTTLEGRVYKNCIYFGDEQIASTMHITRPDQHTVRVEVGKRALLGKGVDSFRWRAATGYEESGDTSPCPPPEPHGDGGYGACTDFTTWNRHR